MIDVHEAAAEREAGLSMTLDVFAGTALAAMLTGTEGRVVITFD